MSKYINRTIEKQIAKLDGAFPVILLSGARQTGKSTLFEYIKNKSNKNINYVTFDDMTQRAIAKEDPELFIRTHETPLIIDEFQYAPEILSYIKIKVDEARNNELFGDKKEVGTMYYLTGSQVFQTMENVSESLAGRIGILELYPLSTREIEGKAEDYFVPNIDILREKERIETVSVKKIFERILRGSYPSLYNNSKEDLEHFYSSYIRTYIERDIRAIINIKNETKFLKFISSVAVRTGQEYNVTDIAKDVGIDNKTADEWMSILTNTYLVYLLQPYKNNLTHRIIKRPKIYFMDTGLACFLAGYFDANVLDKSAYSGAIFETYIVSEIIKSYTNNSKDPRMRLYYYRDNNQKEIDLLVVDQDNIYPVEIKKGANIDKSAVKNFDVVENFGMKSPNGIVLCLTEQIHAISDKCYLVPIEYI